MTCPFAYPANTELSPLSLQHRQVTEDWVWDSYTQITLLYHYVSPEHNTANMGLARAGVWVRVRLWHSWKAERVVINGGGGGGSKPSKWRGVGVGVGVSKPSNNHRNRPSML